MQKPVDLEFDVVVIGGGLSGCTSAFTMIEKDPCLNVLVLEETDKIGGKNPTDSQTIEFISSKNKHLKDLLNKLDLTPVEREASGSVLAELAPDEITYCNAGIPLFGSFVERRKLEYFLSKIELLCEEISLLSPMRSLESEDLDQISMEEYICGNLISERSRNYMRTVIHTNCGNLILLTSNQAQPYIIKCIYPTTKRVQAKDMSALFYIAYCNSTGGIANQLTRDVNGMTGYCMKNASEDMCKAMLKTNSFKVTLNERVTSVWRDYGMISVITDKMRYKCLHVVVAISPDKVLLLDIRPPLSDRRISVLNEISYNLVETTVITHPVPKHLSGDIICGLEEDNAIERSININSLIPNGMFVHLYCNDIKKLENQVKRYFGDEDVLINRCIYEDYHNYKIFGVPSLTLLEDFHEIRRPLYRLFWAGTHTSTRWYGHLEGSVYAGIRAALELLYDYKPQLLTRNDIISLTSTSPPVSIYKDGTFNKSIRHRNYYLKIVLITVIGLFIYKRFIRYF